VVHALQHALLAMFDDNEATAFEPIPLGARQRVIPRRTFKAVPSMITELPLEEILDEQVIATQRVPRLPPPPPHIIRTNVRLSARLPVRLPTAPTPPLLPTLLSRFALPIGGAIVVALLCIYLMLPGHRHGLTAANVAPLGSGFDAPTANFQITTTDDEPPEAPAIETPTPEHPKRTRHHKIIAVDSATPLGNLRPRKF
jgi:hypothetical protein